MEDKWMFRYSMPEAAKGKPISRSEYKKLLLDMLKDPRADHQFARWYLMNFYRDAGQPLIAAQYMTEYMKHVSDPESISICYLKLGQIMEQMNDFESAVRFYAQILEREPVDKQLWYFGHNNLGYSLNQLGRYSEAEWYCRQAIKIDPKLYNAHKNLGVSLEGQGHYVEAARCYITSVRSEASDARALKHLGDLVALHPEIVLEIPDLEFQLQKCREAVEYVHSLYRQRQSH